MKRNEKSPGKKWFEIKDSLDSEGRVQKVLLTEIQYKIMKILEEFGPMQRKDICCLLGYDQFIYTAPRKEGKKFYPTLAVKGTTTIFDNLKKLGSLVFNPPSPETVKIGRPKVLWDNHAQVI